MWMKEVEKSQEFLPNVASIGTQVEATERNRSVLVDWQILLHMSLRLSSETLFIAVNILDRFLTLHQVTRHRIQLVGVTALHIACKYQEIHPPPVQDFVQSTRNAYTHAEVLACEAVMLQALQFNLTFPTSLSFLETYISVEALRATDLPTELFTNMLLDLSLTDL
jgi:hypothetical protein